MSKNYKTGASLAQYVIIIALISLALIPIFLIFGGQLLSAFSNLSGLYSNMEKNADLNSNPLNFKIMNKTLKAGELGGTSSDPVQKCVESVCAIDYGDFVLNGLPDDFVSYVQASGTSGGTDKLLTMLEQIADQLEDQGDTEGSAEYRKMANLGHFIAQMQKGVENLTGAYNYSTYHVSVNWPPDVKELLPDLNINQYCSGDTIKSLSNLGKARKNGTYLDEAEVTKNPSAAMIKMYDTIMANPKYTDSMKGVTTELFREIGVLSTKINTALMPAGGNKFTFVQEYDCITGSQVANSLALKNFSINNTNLTSYVSGKIKGINMNSKLICATGGNKDPGEACYGK